MTLQVDLIQQKTEIFKFSSLDNNINNENNQIHNNNETNDKLNFNINHVLPGVLLHKSLFNMLVCYFRKDHIDNNKKNANSGVQSKLIVTLTVRKKFTKFATALCQNQPILLIGSPGSGKTAILREIARM